MKPLRYRLESLGVAYVFLAAALSIGAAQDNDPLAPALRPPISTNPSDYPANVWVTGSLAKVQPDTSPGSIHWAEISAARNEFESFQVHVRAGEKPLVLDLAVSDFTSASGGRIPATANVQVFREAYANVKQVSDRNGILGMVPDALIPVRDSTFHELRNAFPDFLAPHQLCSAWIDVFVPPGTPAGYYSATVTVKNVAVEIAKLPVVLKVWNFELPSTATLKSAFSISYGTLAMAAYKDYAGAGRYPGANGDSEVGLALAHSAVAALFLDHRISISGVAVGPTIPNGDWRRFDRIYGPLLDGKAATILRGAKLTEFQYPNSAKFDPADLRDYVKHFQGKNAAWAPALFNYVCDEPPSGCSWAQLAQKAEMFRANAPGMRNLVTTNIDFAIREKVLDKVNVLAVVLNEFFKSDGGSQKSHYDTWLTQAGHELWWYQSCNQHESCYNGTSGPKSSTWPSYMIDASPMRNRIFQWMAFMYHVQGELYYQTDLWGPTPWDHLYDFGGNGDGALFYPGTVDKIGGERPVPVPSIRMKLIRDGMEDFEYLAALQRAGKGDIAEKICGMVVQDVLHYTDDPEAFYAARDQLGAEVHRLARAPAGQAQ
jgi:hypothetical protein